MVKPTLVVVLASFTLLAGCSARDFLTRRLATDLIAGSNAFKITEQFWLRTGIVSNKDYTSPEYLVLQRRGWMTASNVPCPFTVSPPPCWDVVLTPIGVETFRDLLPNNGAPSSYFSVPIARRVLVGVTGISKDGFTAEVDFRWKWMPINEVGAAIYPEGPQYNSTVTFRHYDDGWRLVEGGSLKTNQGIDDALKNADPVQ